MRGIAQVVAVAVLGGALSGCDLLTLLGGEDPFPFDPGSPFPSPVATYSAGSATIEMDHETVVLDQIVGTGTLDPDFGTDVKWTNGEGWYLSYYGLSDASGVFADEGYLSIDRIADSEHWVVYNPERCITTTDEAGPNGLSGTAICRGLEWSDYFSAFSPTGVSVEIPGEAPFDADITFEAH